jgi:hypothetical protein
MKRDLKGFVRIDNQGRIVPGSLILRKKMPVSTGGRFIEVTTYECCAPAGTPGGPQLPQTLTTPAVTTGQGYSITITSSGVVTTVATGTNTPATLLTYLQTNYAGLGTYTLDGTSIVFTPTNPGTTLAIGVATNTSIALPTLDVGNPNYHIEIESGVLSTGDVDTGTITGATLVTYLTTNYSAYGYYVLNGTNVVFTPKISGATLAITAGA